MITQWSWGGEQIKVRLPDSDETETIDLDDEVIKHLKNLKPGASVSNEGVLVAIGATISPDEAGEHVMDHVSNYLTPTEIGDLGLIQTILVAANLQIGEIKECRQLSQTMADNGDPIITSQITYYDYSVFINGSRVLDIRRNEKQVTLKSVLRDEYIACNFDIEQFGVLCSLERNAHYDQNVQDIKGFLTTKNRFKTRSLDDCISLSVHFNSKLSGLTKPPIPKQGDTDQYPVLATIALILKAASMVQTSNYDAFIGPFQTNLASFPHPSILCTI
jgi:hypothetical protein